MLGWHTTFCLPQSHCLASQPEERFLQDEDQECCSQHHLVQVRADEYSHSHVNHTFAKLKNEDQNPFEKGAHVVP